MKSKVAPISNPHALSENTEEGILSHNLVQMSSAMMRLLMEESVGGNAGTIVMGGKPFSCAAARGFADAQSGKIIAFGNYQDVPQNIRSAHPEFVFRIVVGFGHGSRIIACSSGDSFSSKAKAMLEKSIERWNSMSAAGSRAA